MHVFCPFSTCGAKTAYEVTKPTRCSRCGKAFADAFKVTITATPVARPVVASAPIPDPIETQRATVRASVLERRNKAKPRAASTRVISEDDPEIRSHIMNLPADVELGPEIPDDENEDVDPREARQRARALAASAFNPDTIIVDDQEDKAISFQSIWNAGAAAREAAATSAPAPKPAKRKRR